MKVFVAGATGAIGRLAQAFIGHDLVANLTSDIPSISRSMFAGAWRDNAVRSEGSGTVIDAAIAAGVRRVLQESVCMMYPDRGSEWIDEDIPPERFRLSRANLAAEANAERFADEGGTAMLSSVPGWTEALGGEAEPRRCPLINDHGPRSPREVTPALG